ncbi:unnamed protein product [Hydatigera taeniaeformis]|uniref:Uncharacterized protein n=1 Tax=Hydatigena taeniaeformis TaxID=6205 RepID=A0A0R3X7Z5_HYDTA|nr:unnamed protein product [Hydatigera taeniaeformis]
MPTPVQCQPTKLSESKFSPSPPPPTVNTPCTMGGGEGLHCGATSTRKPPPPPFLYACAGAVCHCIGAIVASTPAPKGQLLLCSNFRGDGGRNDGAVVKYPVAANAADGGDDTDETCCTVSLGVVQCLVAIIIGGCKEDNGSESVRCRLRNGSMHTDQLK